MILCEELLELGRSGDARKRRGAVPFPATEQDGKATELGRANDDPHGTVAALDGRHAAPDGVRSHAVGVVGSRNAGCRTLVKPSLEACPWFWTWTPSHWWPAVACRQGANRR